VFDLCFIRGRNLQISRVFFGERKFALTVVSQSRGPVQIPHLSSLIYKPVFGKKMLDR
jgi:hypothetical protein